MKKILPGILLISLTSAANSALLVDTYSGYWNALNTWNPGQTGDNTLSTTAEGGPEMQVSGSITYDDTTGMVVALTMSQVGSVTSQWDGAPGEYDTVTMANFAWTSSGTDLRLDSGDVTCNGATAADCGPGFQFGGNYVGAGGPLSNFGPPYSLTDWTGADNFDAYGDILDGPGFEGTVVAGFAQIYTLTAVNPFVALAASGRYDLTLDGNPVAAIPVPAAAWLFGSALVGLFGLKRKK